MRTNHLTLLQCGSCEPLKLGVHATALGLAAVMGVYNAAAWLARRDRHLAINTLLYAALIVWEQHHVAHHHALLARRRSPVPTGATATADEAMSKPLAA